MKIHPVSDIHSDFNPYQLLVTDADVYVFAGDLGEGFRGMNWILENVPKDATIIYVPGNHEYYGHNIDTLRNELAAMANRHGIHFLDNNTVTINGIKFIGTTLWTDFSVANSSIRMTPGYYGLLVQQHLADFKFIKKTILPGEPGHGKSDRVFSWNDAYMEFCKAHMFIEQELKTADPAKTVVVTHHTPCMKSIHPRYDNTPINAGFSNDLDFIIRAYEPALWIHGHTHDGFDYNVGNTRIVCNPRGYRIPSERPTFNPTLTIDI